MGDWQYKRVLDHRSGRTGTGYDDLGLANMCAGWASGYFGLFGLQKQEVSSKALNICGVLVAICSLVLYSFVKPSVKGPKRTKNKFSPKAEQDLITRAMAALGF